MRRKKLCLMQTGASGRPAKRARLEADKRRDALAKVEDKYADIDFTRFHRVEDESSGGATPPRFMLVRPTEAALVRDWRQLSSYEPDGDGRTQQLLCCCSKLRAVPTAMVRRNS